MKRSQVAEPTAAASLALPLAGFLHRARTQHARNRRIMGAVAATVAVALALGVGMASQRLLSAAPVPAEPALGNVGRLAYVNNGDVFVADGDGRNQVRIADGAPGIEGSCDGYRAEGPMWSPDGRYLAYRGNPTGDVRPTGVPCDRTVNISDAAGHRVASFPGHGWAIAWSPDSTRVATWIDYYPGTMIGIYGIDGVRLALLTVPPRFSSEGDFDPVWSPDGESLLLPFGAEIPVDGSAPRQLPADDPRSQWKATYSPYGAHVSYISRDEVTASLSVAAADGSHARVLIPSGVQNAVWSPTGDRIAFASVTGGTTSTYMGPATELGVVDVASGRVTTLVGKGGSDALIAIEFSPEGGQILNSRTDANNVSSLWSIQVDGSDPHLLVPGTLQGDWQAFSTAR